MGPPSIRLKKLICIFALAGCVQNSKTDSKVLIIGVESEIKNLDKRTTNDANTAHVAALYAQTLVRANEKLLPEGDLALSVDVKDGRIFTFKLPPDATFQDGMPLTSADVEWVFRQAAGPGSIVESSFKDVESFFSPDATTFVITLKKSRPAFLLSEVSDLRIYPKHYADRPEFPSKPIGSGPYKFKERRNRDLIFERFENYKRFKNGILQPRPNFDRVIVRTIQDPTTRFLSLMGGDLDLLLNALSPKRIAEALKNEHLQVFHNSGTSYQYFGFNLRLKKFQDLRVRQALALAIDRDGIIAHKLMGFATPASSLLSPVNYFHNPKIPQVGYNPVRAKKLLREAGAENLVIEMKTSTDRDMASIMLVLKEQWEKIGVTLHIRPYEFGTFFGDIRKGNFEMFTLRWTAVTDPDLLNKVFHSQETPPGKNRIFYANAKVDDILDRAQVEGDLQKRKALYDQVQTMIAADTPYISLWYPDNIAIASRALKDFKLNPSGSWISILDARKDAD